MQGSSDGGVRPFVWLEEDSSNKGGRLRHVMCLRDDTAALGGLACMHTATASTVAARLIARCDERSMMMTVTASLGHTEAQEGD